MLGTEVLVFLRCLAVKVLKRITKASNMVANILHVDLGMESVGQNSSFTELGHVAYQIKEEHECLLLANILAADPRP